MDFEGKVALVTGGTRGIGLAVAERLAEQGADLFITYFRSRKDATAAEEKIRSYGVQCHSYRSNMGNAKQLPGLFQAIRETYGRIDVFISNAALGSYTDILGIDRKSWELSMHTNARAFLLCLQMGADLIAENGRIVALSSIGATRYIPGYAAIGVSKAAVENMTRYAAIELASKNITVNCVSGGFVDTSALKVFPNYKELLDTVVERTPFKRVGTPQEMAEVVVFLASQRASWITGQTILVDGGYSLM